MTRSNYISFIFLFIFSFITAGTLLGQEDSTLGVLLCNIEKVTLPRDQQSALIDQLIQKAKKQNNNKYLCRGYLQKIILAYNAYDFEEARKWIELLEPLAIQEKEHFLYFRGKQCFIDLMLVEGELEKGEEEAKKMLVEAKARNYQIGVVLAHLCLSHAYTMSYRGRLAINELEEAYRISSKTTNLKITQEIVHALIASYDNLGDYANQLKYLKEHPKLLRSEIQETPEEEESIRPSLNLAYINFVNYYIKTKDAQMAKQYLDSSKYYYSNNFASVYKAFYYSGSLKYYEYVQDYQNALWCIDSLLASVSIEFDQYAFQATKARILWKSGALKEATQLYEATMLLGDSYYATQLNKQIGQIQQTDENNQILIDKERIQKYINNSLLVTAVALLVLFIWYIARTIKIKKSLEKAEQETRLISQKMESANIAKDKFLSNISQTINTPLNIIVNSSLELSRSDEMSAEKKEELSAVVLKTTERLMILINNILDLSRLEAGMMRFQSEKVAPLSFIRLFLDTASNRQVTISHQLPEAELERYQIAIDSGKFSQLLDSIFTKDKELELSINIKNSSIELTLIGSYLASDSLLQDIIIQNEINLLTIEHFKGEYLIQAELSTIKITLPATYVCEW